MSDVEKAMCDEYDERMQAFWRSLRTAKDLETETEALEPAVLPLMPIEQSHETRMAHRRAVGH